MTAKKAQPAKKASELEGELEQALSDLAAAKEGERRALADYQNLVRRGQQERLSLIKYAAKDLIMSLLEPVQNLDRAATTINDQGLNMVVDQLWQRLEEAGLKKIEVMGKEFDLETMEAVEKNGSGQVVVAVQRDGFRLGDQVIQHARVVMGDK